jgi:hypothetical protein
MAFLAQKTRNFLKKAGKIVQTLSIYSAGGVVAFGWVLSKLLHFNYKTYALALVLWGHFYLHP